MRAHALFCAAVVLAAACIVSQSSLAQGAPPSTTGQSATIKPIGKVISTAGSVTIEHVNAVVVQASLGKPGETKVGDPVYLGDIVQTGADGKLAITFADGTAFNLSSNARLELNEFVYDPNSKSNASLFSVSKGALTFVAGNIAKTGDMRVDTPVATMGIRGTTPHIEVQSDGSVKFSTLFEPGKDEVIQKYGLPGAPPPETAQPREKLNLQICKGC